MSNDDLIESLKTSLYAKIGRNVLVLQHFEKLLKALVFSSQFKSKSSDLLLDRELQKASIDRKTMGQLIRVLFEDHIVSEVENDDTPLEDEEPIELFAISFSVMLKTTPERLSVLTERFCSLLEQRNKLIHHLTDEFPKPTQTAFTNAIQKQELLYSEATACCDELKEIGLSLEQSRVMMADFFKNGEFIQILELHQLQQSQLVLTMRKVISEHSDEEGWALYGPTVNRARMLCPAAFESLMEQWGVKSVKKILLKSGAFQFGYQVLKNNNRRDVIRVAPHFVKDNSNPSVIET